MGADKNKQTDGNDGIVYAVAAVAVLGVVFYLLARLPVFLFGALIGTAMVSNARQRTGIINQTKAFIGTGSVFYFMMYVCFGFSGLTKSDFPGILIRFDWYKDGIFSLASWWNGFIPQFIKGLRLTDAMLTPTNISQFVLTSVIAGTVAAIIAPIFYRLIFPKREMQPYESKQKIEFFKHLFEIPYTVFQNLIEIPIGALVGFGHEFAVKIRQLNFGEVIVFVATLAFGGLIAICLSKAPSVFSFQSTEITFLVGTVLAYAPLTIFLTGFGLGLFPLVGDSVLFHLFESNPTGANILGQKKKRTHGFLLGDYGPNQPFFLTEQNLAYHVEIVAPTGSGKTNILKNLIQDRIEKGHGVIFLDYKADFDVLNWMYRVAKQCNRTEDLRLLSLANSEFSVPYNPLEIGTGSELTSRIMNSFEWSSEQYYLSAAKSALSRIMRAFTEYRELTKAPFHVGHIHRALTDSNYLRQIAAELKAHKRMYASDLIEVAEKIDRPSDAKEIRGLISNLESLMFSSVGSLLSTDTEHGSYSLQEAIVEGRITYCLMNSLLLKESSKAFGKLLLQDLMSFIGRRFATIERTEDHHKPVTLIIDEFAAFAIPEFVDFLDRARSAGIGVIIAHQDRADLKSISPEFGARIEANTNTTIVSGVKDPKDAEHFAGMMGTKTSIKETWQESSGFFGDSATGVKSKREVEEYVVHPNRIKQLSQGEVLSISRTVDPHFGIVTVPRAHEFNEVVVEKSELISYFKKSRELYLKGSGDNTFSMQGNKPGLRLDQDITGATKPVQTETWS
jgi:hypothetical protein